MSDALAGLSQYTDSETDDVISSDTDKEHAVPMQVGQHDHNRDRSPATQLPVSGRANWLKRKLPPLELDRPPQDDDDVDPAAAKSATSGGSAKKLTRGEWLCYCFVEESLIWPMMTSRGGLWSWKSVLVAKCFRNSQSLSAPSFDEHSKQSSTTKKHDSMQAQHVFSTPQPPVTFKTPRMLLRRH
uniref:Uncharacterized protein n=1 Tax=Melanopsichium pennsylvanicum 4 TaxID=1398559 RepID=A0A077R3C2_9BASI|nr:uncharacterized protein BN887_01157 [Melanopsichium pennsylvanicum 4]